MLMLILPGGEEEGDKRASTRFTTFQVEGLRFQSHCLLSLQHALWTFKSPRGWAHCFWLSFRQAVVVVQVKAIRISRSGSFWGLRFEAQGFDNSKACRSFGLEECFWAFKVDKCKGSSSPRIRRLIPGLQVSRGSGFEGCLFWYDVSCVVAFLNEA